MSTQGIEFTTLSLCDALDLAILIEEEAEERYEDFAHQMEIHHTPETAEFFRFMAGCEAKHGQVLVERRLREFENAPSRVERAMLFDVEAPELDRVRAFMSPRQAMEEALLSEVKAQAFFVAALEHIRDPEVRRLFEELRDEEIEHQKRVSLELNKLASEPTHDDDDDFGDDPVAH